ncbi:MAG: DUF4231 domain-containing protein [Bacteroidota bacterium]
MLNTFGIVRCCVAPTYLASMDDLRHEIEERRDLHLKGQRAWSFFHHASTVGAAIISVWVAAIAQSEALGGMWENKDAAIAILALVAAVLAALSAGGGFERKWITNRSTRSRLDALRVDLMADAPDREQILKELRQVIIDHDSGIVGRRNQPSAE